jgi:hypothetical protein
MDKQEGAQVFDDEDLRSGFHVVPVEADADRGGGGVSGKSGASFYQVRYSYDFETCFTKEEWAKVNRFDLRTGRYLSEEEWNGLYPATV